MKFYFKDTSVGTGAPSEVSLSSTTELFSLLCELISHALSEPYFLN